MATLNETIEQVQNVFNDIEGALREQGVDTENLKPVDYADAVRGIVNESVKEIGIFPAIIFTYSKKSEIPTMPVGGKWVIDSDNKNGKIIPPDGWYSDLNKVEDVSTTSDQIWMSTATFKNDGEIYTNWITPFRISGKDGKDGKNGEQGVPGPVIGTTQYFYIPYYIEITDGSTPTTPSGTYVDGLLENVTQGWTTSIAETSYQGTWWMSTASYNSSMTNGDPASFTIPVRISTTSADRKQGTIRYYILSDSPKIPTINDSGWLDWVDGVAPTLQKPYLFCKDVTSYSQSDTETSPPYLLTTYSNGLKSIDFDYTCGESKDVVTSEDYPWFNSTEEALTDNTETGYLGLTEETKFLWCREKFIYVDESQNESFYRILSSYTAAEKAAIIYPAGTFKPEVFYTRTEEQRPYIWYPEGLKLNSNDEVDENGEIYYYFVLKYSYDDDFHKIDINSGYTFESAYRNGNWEKMESFAAIHADVGLIEAGRVGQLVFDDRYIFSQWGKDKSGNIRKYEEFTEYPEGFNVIIPDDVPEDSRRTGIAFAIECRDFIPNILLNAITGEAKFGGGTSVLRADGSGYLAGGKISWDDDGLNVEGHVTAEAFETKSNELSTSISNLESNVETKISEASETWANNLSEYQTATGDTVEKLNKRLDGAVSNYYKEGVPTISIDELKELFGEETDDPNWDTHIGDTWTNINTYDESSEDENVKTGGLSWRWCDGDGDGHSDYVVDIGNKYHWHLISDTDATRALAKAGEALEAANSKTTTFISSKPENPRKGDLWIVPSDYKGNYTPNKTYVYDGESWQPWTDPDLDDIKNAFKSGASGMEGGLVFGEALAVYDQKETEDTDDDKLVAIINGKPTYKNDNGNIVILAAGIDGSEDKIKDAKTMICDNGDLKLGQSLMFDANDGTLKVGNKITIGGEDGNIIVDEDLETNGVSHTGTIQIGTDDSSAFVARSYIEDSDDSRKQIKKELTITLDSKVNCFGGGILQIGNWDSMTTDDPPTRHCLGQDHVPGPAAISIDSYPGPSIYNVYGGIYGLRTGAKNFSTGNETVDYGNFSAATTPQTLFFIGGHKWKFVLPSAKNSQIGDFYELWLGSGDVTITAGDSEEFSVNNSNSFQAKSSYTWSTPGAFKCIFTGKRWWLHWLGK